MASTYSSNLKIELMSTGENSGTWGTITNTNLGTAIEQAIVGYGNPAFSSDANLTISITNSNAAQAARALVLNVTSSVSLTATRELVVPTIEKQYIVQNNTTGAQSITVKTSAGTGITVPNGRKAHLYVDGTNVIQMFDFVDINGGTIDGATVGANSASTGAFTTLTASGATTLNGSVALGDASGDLITVPGTVNSHVLFTDNTYDIGASGATRPRNLFLAGAATVGGNLSVGGTLTLTGGVNLNGNVTVGDSSSDTLTINSTITSNLIFTDNTYDIGASGATRPRNLFLAGAATIGGNTTMVGQLIVDSTTDSSSTTTGSIQTDGGVGIAKSLYVGGNSVISVADNTNAALRITQTGSGNALVVEDSTNPDSTPFVVDSEGRVIAGATSPLITANDNGAAAAKVSATGGTTSSFAALGANSTTARFTSSLTLKRTRGPESAPTTVVSGDYLGRLDFQGYDGTSYVDAALIYAAVDGTPGTNDMPGRLVFSTTADGASTPTEHIRLTSEGKTGFATNRPAATVHAAGDTIVSNVNVLSATYDGVSFSVAAQETAPNDIFFSPDGSKMYIIGSTGDDVNEYALSTPWVVSSATYTTVFSVAAQDTAPQSVFFRADGLKMYIVGSTTDTVYQYSLVTAWSVATATYDSVSFSVAAQETSPLGLTFKPDGLSMYMVGSANDTVYQYTLSTAWDVSTASLLQSFSVNAQETNPTGIQFTGDGSRMFVSGSSGDDITVYDLSTPWSVITASHVGQFSVAAQDTSPQGFYIRPDGAKMYIAGTTNDTVYQYTVPSVAINLTGDTSANGNLAVQQDLTVYGATTGGDMTFSGAATFSSTGALLINKGTTGQQPGSPVTGMLRYNTTTNQFEGYSGSSPAWNPVGGATLSNDTSTSTNVYPLFANATSGSATTVYTSNAKLLYKPSTGELSVSVPRASNGIFVNTQAVAADYTIAATDNGLSAGPVTVNSGITVTVSSGAVWTVV